MKLAVQRMSKGGRKGGRNVVNDEVAPDSGLRPDGIVDGMDLM